MALREWHLRVQKWPPPPKHPANVLVTFRELQETPCSGEAVSSHLTAGRWPPEGPSLRIPLRTLTLGGRGSPDPQKKREIFPFFFWNLDCRFPLGGRKKGRISPFFLGAGVEVSIFFWNPVPPRVEVRAFPARPGSLGVFSFCYPLHSSRQVCMLFHTCVSCKQWPPSPFRSCCGFHFLLTPASV